MKRPCAKSSTCARTYLGREQDRVCLAVGLLKGRFQAQHHRRDRIVRSRSLGVQRTGEGQGAHDDGKETRHCHVLDANPSGFGYGNNVHNRKAPRHQHRQVVEEPALVGMPLNCGKCGPSELLC